MPKVFLYIYDLSNGLAAQISIQLTGRLFKAIHHTSVVYDDREYFFGRFGVESSAPGLSPYGTPIERRSMGETMVAPVKWREFLKTCEHTYGPGKYHLLEHNCNTFSNAALNFLVKQNLDAEILALPRDFLGTPLGVMLRPQIDAMYNVRAQPEDMPSPSEAVQSIESQLESTAENNSLEFGRIDEAYQFYNAPTLSRLFGVMKGHGKELGCDAAERQKLADCTQAILTTKMDCQTEAEIIHTFLLTYFCGGLAASYFPGLDLVRILIPSESFTTALRRDDQLLDKILTLDYAEEDESCIASLSLVLKLICNLLTSKQLHSAILQKLQKHDRFDIITSAPLATNKTISELGLKTIWNLVVLGPGMHDDLAVSCLAAVAECRIEGQADTEVLRQKIITEITSRKSEAIQEMVEILELSGS